MSPNVAILKKQMSKKTTKNKDEHRIEMRQKQVFILHLQGVSIPMIAEALKVNTRTIDRDLSAFRENKVKWLNEQIKKFNVEEYWVKRIEVMENIIKTNWSHLAESDARDRVRLSAEIRECYKEMDLLLRSAGVKTTLVDPNDIAQDTIKIIYQGTESPVQTRNRILLAKREERRKREQREKSLRDENEEEDY